MQEVQQVLEVNPMLEVGDEAEEIPNENTLTLSKV